MTIITIIIITSFRYEGIGQFMETMLLMEIKLYVNLKEIELHVNLEVIKLYVNLEVIKLYFKYYYFA